MLNFLSRFVPSTMPAFLTCSIEFNLHQKPLEAGIQITVLYLKMLLRFSILRWMISIWKSTGIADWIISWNTEFSCLIFLFDFVWTISLYIDILKEGTGYSHTTHLAKSYIYSRYFQMIPWINKWIPSDRQLSWAIVL